LRRAFRIAGAQTVLASHWKVSDKATSQLMTEFISFVGIADLPTKILTENGSQEPHFDSIRGSLSVR
jgi:hypothetical protein